MTAKYGDRKWKDQFIFKAYALAKDGMSDAHIARALSVSPALFGRWLREREALREAVEEGRARQSASEEFKGLVYDRLPEALQDVWDRIEGSEPESKDGPEVARDKRKHRTHADMEVRAMSKRHKQQLFLYALVSCNFNASEARRKCGVAYATHKEWKTDPDFAELEVQVIQTKKDLFEEALVSLVKQGDPGAVIFVNKTYNRDRGYNDKVTLEVSGPQDVTLEQLGLSLEEKRAILNRLRQTAALEDRSQTQSEVIDASFTVTERAVNGDQVSG
jgi:hypothetical protein